MKIRIITTANISYDIEVDSKNFESVVNKILEKKYILLNKDVALLTASISEIHKI